MHLEVTMRLDPNARYSQAERLANDQRQAHMVFAGLLVASIVGIMLLLWMIYT